MPHQAFTGGRLLCKSVLYVLTYTSTWTCLKVPQVLLSSALALFAFRLIQYVQTNAHLAAVQLHHLQAKVILGSIDSAHTLLYLTGLPCWTENMRCAGTV